jgi:hypothetical protein
VPDATPPEPFRRFWASYPALTKLRVLGPRGGGSSTSKQAARGPELATQPAGRTYPAAALVLVALVAFLLGSLLRSLISPADFVYVVANPADADTSAGWREIRRLLELKYLVGGWDFQIAIVRRHAL